METRLGLDEEFGEGNDYEQKLSVQVMSKDKNDVAVRLAASIGIRHIDTVDEVVKKLRALADAFANADVRIGQELAP